MKMDRHNIGSLGFPSQIQSQFTGTSTHIPWEGSSSIQCHLRGTQAQQIPSHFPGTTTDFKGTTFESEW